MTRPAGAPGTLWTIGHWTCPVPLVLETLAGPGIELVVDVRAQPGSRRSPQFSRDVMPEWLGEAGIAYVHLPALAGRRRKQPDIPPELNAGWENASFKNYADYSLTPAYEEGIDELSALATTNRAVIMCGEPMPWRCHRSLVANTLTARGRQVVHLSTTSAPREHVLGAWGAAPQVEAGVVTYPRMPDGDVARR